MKYLISMQERTDEDYKQIFSSNEYLSNKKDLLIKINFTHRSYLFIFILFILISHSNALPISNGITSSYVPQPYKIYQPSYPNGAIVQVHNPVNFSNQQPLKRERYRRKMIDRIFLLFDEDANGQLSKDELYSLSLRLNIFPKYHLFLKKTS
jgi:hypothetical protein